MQTHIYLFEHETLRVGEQGFTQTHFERLARWNEQKKQAYFSLGYQTITVKQFVGVLRIGNLTLEILPKIDAQNTAKHTQKVLLQMLQMCRKISIEGNQNALLNLQSLSLLDIYIELFLEEVQALCRQGLVKQYRQESGNLYTLKGALQFSKHLACNIAHQERFYTRHTVYDHTHLLNQIVGKALRTVTRLTENPYLTDKIARLQSIFPTLPDVQVDALTFERLALNRKTLAYQKALDLSAMILLGYVPDAQGGRQDSIAILFDMNKLYEIYVARLFSKKFGEEYEVQSQTQEVFWSNDSNKTSLRLRPDILLKAKDNQHSNIVLDTKWKIPQNNTPSSADIYQMFAYCQHFEASQGFLVYPTISKGKVLQGKFTFPNDNIHCGLLFLPLLDDDGQLRKEISSLHF